MNKPSLYTLLFVTMSVVLTACGGEDPQPSTPAPSATTEAASAPAPTPEPETPGIEIAAATPQEAYETLKSIIEAGDLEGYKRMMSSGLAQRVQGDFLINDAMVTAKYEDWFSKVPMGEPTIEENTASFFSETVELETVMATYSIVFVKEEGLWKFDTFGTSTRAK